MISSVNPKLVYKTISDFYQINLFLKQILFLLSYTIFLPFLFLDFLRIGCMNVNCAKKPGSNKLSHKAFLELHNFKIHLAA